MALFLQMKVAAMSYERFYAAESDTDNCSARQNHSWLKCLGQFTTPCVERIQSLMTPLIEFQKLFSVKKRASPTHLLSALRNLMKIWKPLLKLDRTLPGRQPEFIRAV